MIITLPNRINIIPLFTGHGAYCAHQLSEEPETATTSSAWHALKLVQKAVRLITSVYGSTENVIIISTRILGCSEENTPNLNCETHVDYIYFLLFLKLFYFISLDAVISSFCL